METLQPRLDPCEEHFQVPGSLPLFLRFLPSARRPAQGAVLYVHGATFPSALSIAYRFDGRSWRDELTAAGFDVWALDFLGYGGSAREPAMAEDPDQYPPLCGVENASRQLEQAVRFILAHQRIARISIIAHSWGTLVTGRFAARFPELVERLVLFGPIACRNGGTAAAFPAWRLVSAQDQWDRFTAELPAGEAPVLSSEHFAAWSEAWLDTDPESRSCTPPAVKTPSGPWYDIGRAWAGEVLYDPAQVRAPVMLVRGAWDTMCSDVDAAWLFHRFASPIRCDVKIARATHLMHLESGRYALYRAAESFLQAGDMAPAADGGSHSPG